VLSDDQILWISCVDPDFGTNKQDLALFALSFSDCFEIAEVALTENKCTLPFQNAVKKAYDDYFNSVEIFVSVELDSLLADIEVLLRHFLNIHVHKKYAEKLALRLVRNTIFRVFIQFQITTGTIDDKFLQFLVKI
jgi:hypothetical protein